VYLTGAGGTLTDESGNTWALNVPSESITRLIRPDVIACHVVVFHDDIPDVTGDNGCVALIHEHGTFTAGVRILDGTTTATVQDTDGAVHHMHHLAREAIQGPTYDPRGIFHAVPISKTYTGTNAPPVYRIMKEFEMTARSGLSPQQNVDAFAFLDSTLDEPTESNRTGNIIYELVYTVLKKAVSRSVSGEIVSRMIGLNYGNFVQRVDAALSILDAFSVISTDNTQHTSSSNAGERQITLTCEADNSIVYLKYTNKTTEYMRFLSLRPEFLSIEPKIYNDAHMSAMARRVTIYLPPAKV
jgi:hypothetical protein